MIENDGRNYFWRPKDLIGHKTLNGLQSLNIYVYVLDVNIPEYACKSHNVLANFA